MNRSGRRLGVPSRAAGPCAVSSSRAAPPPAGRAVTLPFLSISRPFMIRGHLPAPQSRFVLAPSLDRLPRGRSGQAPQSLYVRALDQPLGGGARASSSDGCAGEHPRDFLAAQGRRIEQPEHGWRRARPRPTSLLAILKWGWSNAPRPAAHGSPRAPGSGPRAAPGADPSRRRQRRQRRYRSRRTPGSARCRARPTDLDRKQEPREFAARRHFHERARPRPGIGADEELSPVDPLGETRLSSRLNRR